MSTSGEGHAEPKEPTPEDLAAADLKFHEGKALLDQGMVPEACEKLAQSLALARQGGTLLNLAVCRSRQGRHATALRLFQEALTVARSESRADRAQIAERGVLETRGKLCWLVISIDPAESAADLRVTLDGAPVDAADLGTPIAVDPGRHEILATAGGRAPYRTSVESGGEGDRRSVSIPALAPAPKATSSAEAESPGVGHSGGGQTGMLLAGVGLIGAGATVMIIGGVFGGLAISDASRSRALCPEEPCSDAEGRKKAASAHTEATAANVLIPVGLAFAAAGGALLVIRSLRSADKPSQAVAAPWLSADGAGLVVRGSF